MNDKNNKLKLGEKCDYCEGFGVWAIGDPSPMGPMDFADGMPNKPCPRCGKDGHENDKEKLK